MRFEIEFEMLTPSFASSLFPCSLGLVMYYLTHVKRSQDMKEDCQSNQVAEGENIP